MCWVNKYILKTSLGYWSKDHWLWLWACPQTSLGSTSSVKGVNHNCSFLQDFPGGSDGKESTCNVETWVQSLCWEDPLEEGMATHSSILAWRIPMDREAWWATVHGAAESDTTKRLSTAQEWRELKVDTNLDCMLHSWRKAILRTEHSRVIPGTRSHGYCTLSEGSLEESDCPHKVSRRLWFWS